MKRSSPEQHFFPGMEPEAEATPETAPAEKETRKAESVEHLKRLTGRSLVTTETIHLNQAPWFAPLGIPQQTEGRIMSITELPDGSVGVIAQFEIRSDSGDFQGAKSERVVGTISHTLRLEELGGGPLRESKTPAPFELIDEDAPQKPAAPEKLHKKEGSTPTPTEQPKQPIKESVRAPRPLRPASQPKAIETQTTPEELSSLTEGEGQRFRVLADAFAAYAMRLAEEHSVTTEELYELQRHADNLREETVALTHGHITKRLRDEGDGRFLTLERVALDEPLPQGLEERLLELTASVRQALGREDGLDRKHKRAPQNRGPAWEELPKINNALLGLYTASQEAAEKIRRRRSER